MSTQPDQWLSKTTWTCLADNQSFITQVLEGVAVFAFSPDAPAPDVTGMRYRLHERFTGRGKLWGRAAFDDISTKISVSLDVEVPGLSLELVDVDVGGDGGDGGGDGGLV